MTICFHFRFFAPPSPFHHLLAWICKRPWAWLCIDVWCVMHTLKSLSQLSNQDISSHWLFGAIESISFYSKDELSNHILWLWFFFFFFYFTLLYYFFPRTNFIYQTNHRIFVANKTKINNIRKWLLSSKIYRLIVINWKILIIVRCVFFLVGRVLSWKKTWVAK